MVSILVYHYVQCSFPFIHSPAESGEDAQPQRNKRDEKADLILPNTSSFYKNTSSGNGTDGFSAAGSGCSFLMLPFTVLIIEINWANGHNFDNDGNRVKIKN